MSTGYSRHSIQKDLLLDFTHIVVDSDIIQTAQPAFTVALLGKMGTPPRPDRAYLVTIVPTGKTYAQALSQHTTFYLPFFDKQGVDIRGLVNNADLTFYYGNPNAIVTDRDSTSHIALKVDKVPELKFIGRRDEWDTAQVGVLAERYFPYIDVGANWLSSNPVYNTHIAVQFCPDVFVNSADPLVQLDPASFRTRYENRPIGSCIITLSSISPFSSVLTPAVQGGAGLPQKLNDLTDVQHTEPPANGEVLTWVTANNRWESLPAASSALALNRTNDDNLYRIRVTGSNVPASGELVFLDVGDNVVQPNIATKVRVHSFDANGLDVLWGNLHPVETQASVWGQYETGKTTLRAFNFKTTSNFSIIGAYTEAAINGESAIGTFADGDLVHIGRRPLDVDRHYRVDHPIYHQADYDFVGQAGPLVVATAAINTWYPVTFANFADVVSNGMFGKDVGDADYKFTYPYSANVILHLALEMYGDQSDNRLEMRVQVNGTPIQNAVVANYSKNRTTIGEGSSSLITSFPLNDGDLFRFEVQVAESNAPDPEVSQISISKCSFSLVGF